jgi:hypothetical protein
VARLARKESFSTHLLSNTAFFFDGRMNRLDPEKIITLLNDEMLNMVFTKALLLLHIQDA